MRYFTRGIVFAAMLSMSSVAGAADEQAATQTATQIQLSHHLSDKTYGQAEYYRLSNKSNSYVIYYQWVKPTAKTEPEFMIGMPEPVFWYNFENRGFMDITVNGVKSKNIEPLSTKVWNESERSGIDTLFNFDGIKLTLRFYLRKDSPVLWGELIPDAANQSAIKEMKVIFNCKPSMVVSGQLEGIYERELVTPARTMKQETPSHWHPLTSGDEYIIFTDLKFQPGPKDEKSQGPCFVRADWTNVQSAQVWFGNEYAAHPEYTINPESSNFRFGLFESKKRYNNKEFIEMVKKQSAEFSFNK